MPQPTVRSGHVDRLLTNMSVAYFQAAAGFVADKVFPRVGVAEASGFYYEFPREWFWRDHVGPRPMGGYPRQVGYELTTKPYILEEQALEAFLDDRERKNATPPHNPERSKVQLLTQQHLIHRDREWADAFFKTGVWGLDLTGVAAGPTGNQILRWDAANSDPIGDIDLQKEAMARSTGLMPNVLVIGAKVYRVLKNHPKIMDLIKYTQRGQITAELLASMFEVDRLVIARAVRNTTEEGETPVYDFILDESDALLVHSAPSPGLDVPTAGYILGWDGLLGAGSTSPTRVDRGREDRAHSDWFHVRVAYDMHKVAAELGTFFDGAVTP